MGFSFRINHDASPAEFPEGEYAVSVAKIEKEKSEKSQGDYLSVDFLVLQASQSDLIGRKLPGIIVSLVDNAQWKAAMFMDALGLGGKGVVDHSSDELIGRQCRVKGGTRAWKGNDGISRKRFEVDVFMSLSGAAPALVPSNGGSAAPAPARAAVTV
ncbi:MAG: DUF669 domain-containing protein [Candidatus Omnitrophota bacterium]